MLLAGVSGACLHPGKLTGFPCARWHRDFIAAGNAAGLADWVMSYLCFGAGTVFSIWRCTARVSLHVCYCNANHGGRLWLATAVQFLDKQGWCFSNFSTWGNQQTLNAAVWLWRQVTFCLWSQIQCTPWLQGSRTSGWDFRDTPLQLSVRSLSLRKTIF